MTTLLIVWVRVFAYFTLVLYLKYSKTVIKANSLCVSCYEVYVVLDAEQVMYTRYVHAHIGLYNNNDNVHVFLSPPPSFSSISFFSILFLSFLLPLLLLFFLLSLPLLIILVLIHCQLLLIFQVIRNRLHKIYRIKFTFFLITSRAVPCSKRLVFN